MSQRHPLAVVNAGSITSLVRITLCHHSISVYRAQCERPTKSEARGTPAFGAAMRCDCHLRPSVTDGAPCGSERETVL